MLAVARVMDRTWRKMPALITVAYHTACAWARSCARGAGTSILTRARSRSTAPRTATRSPRGCRANLSGAIDAGDGTLLGKRLVTSEELPLIGGSPVEDGILCGDFDAGYELVRIGPMTLIRDDISVKGKVSFYTAQRFGGRLVDNDAIKVLRA